MALYQDLKKGDSLDIDDGRVVITVEEKTGSRTRVKIDADRSVKVRKVASTTSRQIASLRGLSVATR